MKLGEQKELRIILRYVTSGLIGNGLVLIVYFSLTLMIGLQPRVSFVAACAIICPISFWLSRNWTFSSKVAVLSAFALFLAGYITSAAFQLGVLHVGLLTGMSHAIAVPFAQGLAALMFYLLQRIIIFTGPKV